MVFNFLFKEEIKALEGTQQELIEHIRDDSPQSSTESLDETLSNTVSVEFDEFGCERIPGQKFNISPTDTEKYILNPVSKELIPYSLIESLLKTNDLYKKYKLSESFNEGDVSNEIMTDMLNFYGGSFNSYFEWTFQKQRLMFERSQEECQKGIGKAIKDITTNFVLGDGIGFEYTDINITDQNVINDINQALWKIWQDNEFDLKQYTISDYAIERGEVFIKLIENAKEGEFQVKIIDPWEVTDYLYDPSSMKVKCWFRDGIENGMATVREPLLTQGAKDKNGNPYIVHQYKFNVSSNLVRGRSDIYSVLYWIKIYNDFLKCRSRLNRFRSSVAWHKKIEGGSKAISQGATKVQKPFPPGVVLVSDAKTTYEALKAEINAGDVKDDGDAFKVMISSTTQIPHHWLFGSGEHTNLATAKNMSAVPKRKFLRRQKELKTIFQEIFWHGLKFILGKSTMKNNSISIKEGIVLQELKTKISNLPRQKDVTKSDEEFVYRGQLIKKKYLEIQIPNIDEHNAEDLLKLVNAAAIMRKNAIGSNRAVYDLIGLNYKKDQEIMEREWTKGDFEIFRNVIQVFNKFDNAPGGDTTSPPKEGNGIGVQSTAPSSLLDNDALDANHDGVTGANEEPEASPIDDIETGVNKSKSARGGG